MTDNILTKDGNGVPVSLAFRDTGLVDAQGNPIKVPRGHLTPSPAATDAINPVTSSVIEAGHVVKNSPGNFYGGYVTVPPAVSVPNGFYLITLNLAAVPNSGASIAPVECVFCPGNSNTYSTDNGDIPDAYSVGIVMVASTTPFQYTPVAGCIFKGRAA